MSELAFNANGDPFEVPAIVTGWRVRRMKPRGAPELVYGRDGRPLVVAIETEIDDLRAAVGALGRYRLDPVDDDGKVIENVPAAYVQVVKPERVPETAIAPRDDGDSVIREAMRLNTELAKSVVDRFPEMMTAAAELLRAADGAGIPARQPRIGEAADDDEHDETQPLPGFDLNALVAQLVPMLVLGFTSGKMKLPNLAGMLDWRKAAAEAEHASPARPHRARHAAKESLGPGVQGDPSTPQAPAELPQIDAATMAHFIAVQAMLTAEDSALARELAAELSPPELRAWFEELSKLGVAQAAEKIRKVVSGAKGGAS
ncbi:MAG: hypothetical protein WKG01_11280 [Kofleriaceae bacterium]